MSPLYVVQTRQEWRCRRIVYVFLTVYAYTYLNCFGQTIHHWHYTTECFIKYLYIELIYTNLSRCHRDKIGAVCLPFRKYPSALSETHIFSQVAFFPSAARTFQDIFFFFQSVLTMKLEKYTNIYMLRKEYCAKISQTKL